MNSSFQVDDIGNYSKVSEYNDSVLIVYKEVDVVEMNFIIHNDTEVHLYY